MQYVAMSDIIFWQQLARQLENQANVTDPSLRLSTQSSAWSSGFLLHNIGAFLLELGRATTTLRLGQTPVGLFSFLLIVISTALYVVLCVIYYAV